MGQLQHSDDPVDYRAIERRIRHDKMVMDVLKLSADAYLVGGYIRDIATGRNRPLDSDFIFTNKVNFIGQKIARRQGGAVVVLGKEKLVRVILKKGRTLDLSRYGFSVDDDLRKRDFTINSIAWSPMTGLLDPCKGLLDIKQGVIRSFSKLNLLDDPLRILRAYRFKSQFGWRLDSGTRAFIKESAHLLSNVAHERVTFEFFKLLEGEFFLSALKALQRDGVLEYIIPLKNNMKYDKIKAVSRLLKLTSSININKRMSSGFQGLRRVDIMKISLLLLGINPSRARLTLSSKLSKRIKLIGSLLDRFENISKNRLDEMFDCFEAAEDAAEDLLVLSGKEELLTALKRFMRIQGRPLIDARGIMALMGLREGGVLVGRSLRDIKKKQFTGELKTRRSASSYIKLNLDKYS